MAPGNDGKDPNAAESGGLTRRWPAGLIRRSCNTAEIVELLETTKWVDDFSPEQIRVLARYLYVCEAAKGAMVVQEGGLEGYLCLLINGRVSIVKAGADGRTMQLGSAIAGSTFGEMSLVDHEPRSASVIAEEPSLFVVLTGQGLEDLTAEVPQLAVKVLLKIAKVMSERLRETSGALVDSSRAD
jgi:CRP/FNR family transcriptional regulator, cyclic AMP receptor protein